jgi:hypothetical protein
MGVASVTDDYCELCDLPLSTCVHGRPPTPPTIPAPSAPSAPARPSTRRPPAPRAARVAGTPKVEPRRVPRRWTPSEDFRPHLLEVLREHDGRLDADDLMLELEIRLDDRLTPGDRERAPQGGERWHLAVRKQRKAMLDEGLLVPAQPGVWQLTGRGLG